MRQIYLLVIVSFVAGVSAGICLSVSPPLGVVALIAGLGIIVGGMLLAQHRRQGVAEPAAKAPPHRYLFYGVDVWFPLGGQWVKGQIVDPVDPERTRYRVAEGWGNMLNVPRHEVEYVDLRDGRVELTEPAPVLTVPEMEAQMQAERDRVAAEEWEAGEPERYADRVRQAIEIHGRFARGEKVWREESGGGR